MIKTLSFRSLSGAVALALLTTASVSNAQDSAQSIAEGFEKQKVEALNAYLKKNPEAEDRERATQMLIDGNFFLGNTEAVVPLLEERYDSMDKGEQANLQELMGGVVAPLIQMYAQTGNADKAKTFIETVTGDFATHPAGQQIGGFLQQLAGQLDQPQVGGTLDIAFTSTTGEEIDLAKMKGKVVLVDFWATWCGPCIAEMPNVIAAYEKYNEKGFEILGISLDKEKEALVNYTTENKMTWPQYFDGKHWENDFAVKYGIKGIPATFLLGKDGKIIASNLRGPALEQALEKALAVE